MRIAKKNIEQDHDTALLAAQLCVSAAEEKKAGKIITLDVSKLTSYADFFVICSAPSERQVQAIVRNVSDTLRGHSIKPIGSEGMENSNWILLDFGSVIFHCFTDSAREYYDLEGFWIDAKKINFDS